MKHIACYFRGIIPNSHKLFHWILNLEIDIQFICSASIYRYKAANSATIVVNRNRRNINMTIMRLYSIYRKYLPNIIFY